MPHLYILTVSVMFLSKGAERCAVSSGDNDKDCVKEYQGQRYFQPRTKTSEHCIRHVHVHAHTTFSTAS